MKSNKKVTFSPSRYENGNLIRKSVSITNENEMKGNELPPKINFVR